MNVTITTDTTITYFLDPIMKPSERRRRSNQSSNILRYLENETQKRDQSQVVISYIYILIFLQKQESSLASSYREGKGIYIPHREL